MGGPPAKPSIDLVSFTCPLRDAMNDHVCRHVDAALLKTVVVQVRESNEMVRVNAGA
jgi:hypothetical protein